MQPACKITEPVFHGRRHTCPTLSQSSVAHCRRGVEGADDDAAQTVTYRRTADKSAALVRERLHTSHHAHRQPVIRRVPVSSSLQDIAGAAAAEETRPGQGADVQLR